MKTTNISLGHDAFTQYGGAERVFEAAVELFPNSPIYTLVVDKTSYSRKLPKNGIIISPLQWLYNFHRKLTHWFWITPFIFWIWRAKKTDLLLTFSSSFVKALRKPKGAIHINYCHTPTRFLWIDPEHAFKEMPSILHPFAKIYFWWMKRWDLHAASRIDVWLANSKEVQQRIKKVYGKDSELLYPFIDTTFWQPTQAKQDYFLIAGRLQYSKGLETVISLFNEIELPLHVIGTGRYENELKTIAKNNVKFLGKVTDEQLRDEYSGARGFIYPQFEDFGLMPLEAAACGTASIGLAKGGSLETIIPDKTGELLEVVNKQTLSETLKSWNMEKYTQSNLIDHAHRFSKQIFKEKLKNIVEAYGDVRKL